MDRSVRLRPHHLLCQRGFRGFGYDDAFVAAFLDIVIALAEAKSSILVVDGADDLCSVCPFLVESSCSKGEDRVRKLDKGAAALLDILPGDVIDAAGLSSTLSHVKGDDLANLCAECEWFEYGYCVEAFNS